ncbi:hypothetical protein D9M72_506280 [compost metagenome]
MRDHRAGKFGDGDETAFDMHVGVAKAGHQVAAVRIDDLGVGADRVAGVRADIGEAASFDGDIGAGNDLAGIDVDPFSIADHEIGRLAAHGNVDQFGCGSRPGLKHVCFLRMGDVGALP